jgi:hypothetical protein
MIWALVFAAIAAVAVVLTTRIALTRAKQVTGAQTELIDAKDRQLAHDLKSKDEKIADAGAAASAANERAETARLEQEKLKAQLAWRLIPPSIAPELKRVLSANPGSVNLRYTDGDPEALYLAIQFLRNPGHDGQDSELMADSIPE